MTCININNRKHKPNITKFIQFYCLLLFNNTDIFTTYIFYSHLMYHLVLHFFFCGKTT